MEHSAEKVCICPHFSDTGGFRIADLCCPVHGLSGTEPGDGYWDEEPLTDAIVENNKDHKDEKNASTDS